MAIDPAGFGVLGGDRAGSLFGSVGPFGSRAAEFIIIQIHGLFEIID
jgi:hypothetical protein